MSNLMHRMPNSTICLPAAVSAELTADCYHVVSVNYLDIQNNETAMFPEQIENGSTNHLFNNIIGLTINNDTEKIEINQTQGTFFCLTGSKSRFLELCFLISVFV